MVLKPFPHGKMEEVIARLDGSIHELIQIVTVIRWRSCCFLMFGKNCEKQSGEEKNFQRYFHHRKYITVKGFGKSIAQNWLSAAMIRPAQLLLRIQPTVEVGRLGALAVLSKSLIAAGILLPVFRRNCPLDDNTRGRPVRWDCSHHTKLPSVVR